MDPKINIIEKPVERIIHLTREVAVPHYVEKEVEVPVLPEFYRVTKVEKIIEKVVEKVVEIPIDVPAGLFSLCRGRIDTITPPPPPSRPKPPWGVMLRGVSNTRGGGIFLGE